MVKNKSRVFVYGSLKKEHGLHKLISRSDHEDLGRNWIESNYMMADMGAFPALVADLYDPTNIYRVYGEVYAVDQETLAALDFAEGHPHFYNRKKLEVGPDKLKCWVYVIDGDHEEYAEDWIDDGIWKPTDAEKHYVTQCEKA